MSLELEGAPLEISNLQNKEAPGRRSNAPPAMHLPLEQCDDAQRYRRMEFSVGKDWKPAPG